MAIAVRASSPGGMGSTIDSFTRARWENPPHQLTPRPLPVTSTGSPGRNRALVLDAHAAREVDAGHHRPLADDLPPTGERQPVLVVQRAVGDVDGHLAGRKCRLLERRPLDHRAPVRLLGDQSREGVCHGARHHRAGRDETPAGLRKMLPSQRPPRRRLASVGGHSALARRSQGNAQGGVGVVGRGGAWAVACRAVADLCWSASRRRPRLRPRVGGAGDHAASQAACAGSRSGATQSRSLSTSREGASGLPSNVSRRPG